MSSRDSTGNNQICLVVSGLAMNTPFLSSWQRFKDEIRSFIEGQPKTVFTEQRWDQTNRGWAYLKNRDDGETAFCKCDIEA
jgi:hypothetical protein